MAFACASAPASAAPAGALVVCADPNNLPFSNRARQGFENRLVDLLARDMQAQVSYVWWAQRRGYARNTLDQGRCDLWPGVATEVSTMATTRPYYRSTYVFVTRADRRLDGLTLDDTRLRSLSIGVQMVGNDAMNTPPAHALARRGLIDNVRGYMLSGDYQRPNPPAAIVDAVASGSIDVALVWGPLAGYFARRSAVALRLDPVLPQYDGADWPMAYNVSVGVRRDNVELRDRIDRILEQRKAQIGALLNTFHVPQAPR
jgi:mxaJ protein